MADSYTQLCEGSVNHNM